MTLDSVISGMIDTESDTRRKIESRTSFARAAYWHYDAIIHSAPYSNQNDDKPNVKLGVMSAEIESVKIDKDINNAAGNFEITVLPSKNWKKEISPGDWIVIYLYTGQESSIPNTVTNQNVAMFGNVDRVARSKQRDENSDKTLVRYVISGRDFGKVLTDTDVFFDPRNVKTQNRSLISTWLMVNGVPFSGSPSTLVQKLLSVFVGGAPVDSVMDKGTQAFDRATLRQWMIPGPVISFFAGSALPYPKLSSEKVGFISEILNQQIAELPGHAGRTTVDSGESVWELLTRTSNKSVNELFVDLRRNEDGTAYPTIVLRPRPQSPLFTLAGKLDPAAFNALGTSWKTIRDHSKTKTNLIELDDNEVLYENIGKNQQAMFNMVWMKSQMMDATVATWPSFNSQSGLEGVGNPMYCRESINRFGLKMLDEMQAFVYDSVGGKDTNLAVNILKGFLLQRYDQVAYNHLYDNGTMETVGTLNAAVGMVLKINPPADKTKFDYPKLFYVEGYSHEYKYPNIWTTTWKVTNGIFDDAARPFIDIGPLQSGEDWGALVAQTIEYRSSDREFMAQMGVDLKQAFNSPFSLSEGL